MYFRSMNFTLLVKEFILALKSYKHALTFIIKNGLLAYYLAPFLVGLLFIIVSFFGISFFTDWLDALFQQWFGVTVKNTSFNFIKDYQELIADSGRVVITILLKILMFFLVFRLNKYVTLIILSPVLAYLSERVEVILTGKDFPFDTAQFLKDVWRGVLLALRNMVIEISAVIILWALSFAIPILIPITAAILFFVSAYYYGFAMLDYSNERRRMGVKESIHYIRKHKGLTMGNGMVYQLLVNIPFFGAVVAPITAVVAATLSVHELEKPENELLQ